MQRPQSYRMHAVTPLCHGVPSAAGCRGAEWMIRAQRRSSPSYSPTRSCPGRVHLSAPGCSGPTSMLKAKEAVAAVGNFKLPSP